MLSERSKFFAPLTRKDDLALTPRQGRTESTPRYWESETLRVDDRETMYLFFHQTFEKRYESGYSNKLPEWQKMSFSIPLRS